MRNHHKRRTVRHRRKIEQMAGAIISVFEELEQRRLLSGAPPVAAADQFTTDEDVPLAIVAPGVLANDTDPENDPLTAVLVTQPANGAVALNPDGSFTYSPNPDFNGTDSFTYAAHDGTSLSEPATVTITINPVNDAPITADDSYTTPVGQVLTVDAPGVLANDTDVEGDTLTAVLVSQPANGAVTLNPDGSFTYTPNGGFNGIDTFTYRANDGAADGNVATVTITVNTNPLAVADAYSIDEDGTLLVLAPGVLENDSDIDGNTLTAILVQGTQHGVMSLQPNGLFTYQPNPNFHGTDSFTYQASDGFGLSNIATVVITVNPVNDPPVAGNDSYTMEAGTTLTMPAPGVLENDSDVDGDPLTAVLVGSTPNGTLTLNSDGSFTYTPNEGFIGVDVFTYVASDGQLQSEVATVQITVTGINTAPVAQPDAYTTPVGAMTVIAAPGVLANDSDADGDTLTAVLISGPSNGTLTLNPDGSFIYTPNEGFNGIDSFTYRANDGAAFSNDAVVTITVNTAPVAADDAFTTDEDTTLVVDAPGVVGNDSDVDGNPLTAVLVSGPSNGTLTLNADGSFTYVPNADFHGTDSFTYAASDGLAQSNPATVVITVNAVNDAPVAVDDAFSVQSGSTLSVVAPGVLANDSDVEGDALVALLVSGPGNGTLELNPNGSFVYIPNPGFVGADSFTYVASDGQLQSNTAMVLITVSAAANTAPVTVGDSYTTPGGVELTVAAPGVLANDSDADGDTLTAVLVSGPAHGTLTLNADGSFTYVPNAGFNGIDAFTYRANDGTDDGNEAVVTITVNTAPVAAGDAFTTDEDTTLVVNAPGVLTNDTDADDNTLTAVLLSAPANGTLTLNPDGSFTYVPNADFHGTDSFTYAASDGLAQSSPATVVITVNPVNDPPVSSDNSFTVNAGSTLTVGAPGVLANDTDVDGDALTAVLVSGPSNGTLTLNADGSFVYVPNAGFAGTDSFTYRASDGTVQGNTATVSIQVTAAVPPLVANDVNSVRAPAASVSINVLSHVTGGAAVAGISIVGFPFFGSVSINNNGTPLDPSDDFLVYQPDGRSTRRDQFTYRVTDVLGNTATGTVRVDVVGAALLPSPIRAGLRDLVVLGTNGDDIIRVVSQGGRNVQVILNNQALGTFNVSGRIIVKGFEGNDGIDVTGVPITARLYGGAGNDTLIGGNGRNWLFGGPGNNQFVTRNAFDVVQDDDLFG